MGKGDIKTRRGKIVNKSFGVRRKKNKEDHHTKVTVDKVIDKKVVKPAASVTSGASEKTPVKSTVQNPKKQEPATIKQKKENIIPPKTDKKPVEKTSKENAAEKPEAKKASVEKEDPE